MKQRRAVIGQNIAKMGNYSIMSCPSASNSSPDILLLERTLSLDCIDVLNLSVHPHLCLHSNCVCVCIVFAVLKVETRLMLAIDQPPPPIENSDLPAAILRPPIYTKLQVD